MTCACTTTRWSAPSSGSGTCSSAPTWGPRVSRPARSSRRSCPVSTPRRRASWRAASACEPGRLPRARPRSRSERRARSGSAQPREGTSRRCRPEGDDGAMRLATWNVNSIRSRADRVVAWLQRRDVDVLALQETKCRDDQFPESRFTDLGYQVAHVGFSQWNGVAILSRVGLDDVEIGFPGQPCWSAGGGGAGGAMAPDTEARALAATCGGVRVWSLYVPNGRTLSDPHYQYKLQWLGAVGGTAGGGGGA